MELFLDFNIFNFNKHFNIHPPSTSLLLLLYCGFVSIGFGLDAHTNTMVPNLETSFSNETLGCCPLSLCPSSTSHTKIWITVCETPFKGIIPAENKKNQTVHCKHRIKVYRLPRCFNIHLHTIQYLL